MTGKVSNTLRALNELRDEQARTGARIEQLEQVVSSELRAVAAVLIDVRDLLRDRLDVRDEFRDHERRIAALERRAG